MSQNNSGHKAVREAVAATDQSAGLALSPKRAFVRPEADDDWLSIAARVFPQDKSDEAVDRLQSWNFHVLMRAGGSANSNSSGPRILPSDIIFVAPPEPNGAG